MAPLLLAVASFGSRKEESGEMSEYLLSLGTKVKKLTFFLVFIIHKRVPFPPDSPVTV